MTNREQAIEQNLGLVRTCANRFRGKGIEYDDLYQAGCMGLVKAVDGFDESRGLRFSTYAVPVILGEIRRLFRDGGNIKVSRTIKEQFFKANRARDAFMKRHGREPTISELAVEMNITMEMAGEIVAAAQPVVSLTESGEEGGGQFDIPVPSVEEEMGDILSLKEVVNTLPEEEQKLITLRYFRGKTQTQTAQILGLTQVQVSRKEKKILLNMRAKLTG